ncbi:unnamed protein product [Lampetra fluviatilis]
MAGKAAAAAARVTGLVVAHAQLAGRPPGPVAPSPDVMSGGPSGTMTSRAVTSCTGGGAMTSRLPGVLKLEPVTLTKTTVKRVLRRLDAWRAITGQLELLQQTMAQLAAMMAEVGDQAPRELRAILCMTPQPGAILNATPETAAMPAVMAAPMDAAAPHVATEEALWALLTCLDARALQAFKSIPPADRASLQSAYQQMAAVFEPPSSGRLKFSMQRREEGESPLAFRCSLLALAQAAYPNLVGKALYFTGPRAVA